MIKKSGDIGALIGGTVLGAFAIWAGCVDCAVLIVVGIFVLQAIIKQRKLNNENERT